MYLLEFWIGDMCIHLRGTDARMTKHLLDTSEVCSSIEQCRCKWVPERVGWDIFYDIRFDGMPFYHSCDEKSRKSYFFIFEYIDIISIYIVSEKEGRHVVLSRIEILFYESSCMLSQIDDSHFSSLSTYGKLPGFQIDIVFIESCELADTKPCRVDTLHDG